MDEKEVVNKNDTMNNVSLVNSKICIEEQYEKSSSVDTKTKTLIVQTPMTLERKSNIRRTLIYIIIAIIMEMTKQLCTYGMSTSHDGDFPISTSLMVVIVEVTKLLIVLASTQIIGNNIRTYRISMKFCIPALCYLVANIMYLRALVYTSPPIWIMLIQTRSLYTAAAYKIIFGRQVTWLQCLGCGLIVCSIPFARASEVQMTNLSIEGQSIFLSQISAVLSTIAAISIEIFLKNDKRSFAEQQIWLYLFGSGMGFVAIAAFDSFHENVIKLQNIYGNSTDFALFIVTVLSTSLSGLTVPIIVKNLDCIVKDYIGALENIILALLTAVFFPSHFALSISYILSLLLLLSGIALYEKSK